MQHPIFSYIVAPIIYSMIQLLAQQTELYHNSDAIPDRFRATYFETGDTYDFIVVGAGSAGCVVANRLVKSNFSVLLLEAGGEMQPGQFIPSTSLLLLDKPYIDWSHVTVPQTKACQSLKNKQSGWSAGKGLGGTSLLNFLQYMRGHPKDYEYYANITGDPEWNYENVIQHFKAIEDFHDDFGDKEIYGRGGEVTVQIPPYVGMGEHFIKAGQEKGYPNVDLNGRFDEGFSLIFNNIKNGRRLSSSTAFLEPIRNNPKLTIRKFAEVTRILLRDSDSGPEAYGVEYLRHGELQTAYAEKEVIISAGVVNSPKLLMVSGIGPKQQLEPLGIRSRVDRPGVGKNLQDHLSVYLGPFILSEPVSMLLDRDVNSETMTEFIDHGTGPLTSSGTCATAMISSSYAKAAGEGDWPDIQLVLIGTGVYTNFAKDFAHGFHIEEHVLKKYLNHAKGLDSFQVIVSGAHPVQRGELWLNSGDPLEEPLMDPKYLHNDYDVNVLVEGIKRTIDLVENTTAFQRIGAKFTHEVFPGCENVEFRSDDYWRCYIREYSVTLHHIVGTCSMGRRDSQEAVVDSELRVIGVNNLRVIDAGVIPKVPSANTHAPVMMVGQKGASAILKKWTNRAA